MIPKKITMLTLLSLALVLSACQRAEKQRTPPAPLPAVQVAVESLNAVDVPFQVELAGTLKAVEHAIVSSG